ncbi:hypothetical protein Xkoz_01582 [Xenorhabdus kozodoii]|uniref:Uncharacterized protein n=1 Tax=Xenorhabdus kozodoii TaxID=351676 RepID=A0A2D0LDU3_9GAMM|nr:hypothetical protein Xkoz_01582 [Xenorhabdus kozodoii]
MITFLSIEYIYQPNFKMRVIFPRAAGKYKALLRFADYNLKFIEYKIYFLKLPLIIRGLKIN